MWKQESVKDLSLNCPRQIEQHCSGEGLLSLLGLGVLLELWLMMAGGVVGKSWLEDAISNLLQSVERLQGERKNKLT